MKPKIGICIWCVPVAGIEPAVRWASMNGLQGIELDLGDEPDPQSLYRPEIQNQYIELGKRWEMTFPTLGVNVLCQYGMSVGSHHIKAKAAIEKAIEVADTLGIRLVQLPSFFNGKIDSEEGFQNTVECLRYACRQAEGTDILIGSENVLQVQDQFRLMKAVGHPKFNLYFDTRNHFSMKGLCVPPILEQVYRFVQEVHLKDGVNGGHSTLLGNGNSSFFGSLEVLMRRNYTGWMILENDYKEIAFDTGISPEALIKTDIELITSIFR